MGLWVPELGQRAANPRAVKPIGGSHGPSRGNDNALGPCVDHRAAMANALHPDAIVSIHADGGPPEGRGFMSTTPTRRSTTRKPVPPYDSRNPCAISWSPRACSRQPIAAPTHYTGAPIWPV